MRSGYFNSELMKNRRRDLRKRSTEAERLLWESIRNRKVGVKFVRQYSVSGYVLDFYCAKFKIGIELNGGIHKRSDVVKYDKYRKRYIEAFGIAIVEFNNSEVEDDTEEVMEKIKKIILERGEIDRD
jgi:very-short-patch-repair endonuclease